MKTKIDITTKTDREYFERYPEMETNLMKMTRIALRHSVYNVAPQLLGGELVLRIATPQTDRDHIASTRIDYVTTTTELRDVLGY